MRSILVALLVILLAGCGHTRSSESENPRFTTDSERYAPGAEVTLQLHNPTEQVIGYNLCFSGLERQSGQGWQPVNDPDTVCTTILNGLQPGDNTSYTKTLMPDLPAGTYRFHTEIEHNLSGEREPLFTEPFSVGS